MKRRVCNIKRNNILNIKDLDQATRKKVRNEENGLFTNTFIIDGKTAYGYGDDGKSHILDAISVDSAARFIWHIDKDGYVVTDNVITPYGRKLHMEELVMGMFDI